MRRSCPSAPAPLRWGRPAGTESVWNRLVSAERGDRPERFDPDSLASLPAPAARWLARVLPAGVDLIDTVQLSMSGEIRLGSRWMPFTAQQILRAGVGFVWAPTVGGRFLRFVGADILSPDDARMEFRLHGIVPVAKASGTDTARSAAGRLAAETVAWLPHAVVPQAGARWRPVDDTTAVVELEAGGETVEVHVAIDADGALRGLGLQRWNDAAQPSAAEPFGGAVTSEHVANNGVRVAGSGTVGWGYGTPGAADGEFFRYVLHRVEWIRPGSISAGCPT